MYQLAVKLSFIYSDADDAEAAMLELVDRLG